LRAFFGIARAANRASSVPSAIQAAGDAAALMPAKTASTLTPTQLHRNANAYFLASFNRPEAQSLQVTTTIPGTYPDSSKFLLLISANEIVTTFDTIGTSLQKRYLAK
jgi:hypothetical protein